MNQNNTNKDISAHYDEAYFANYQKEIGEFSGWAETIKFAGYILPSDTVIDFGCGGGYILKNIICARKMGVEINDTARACAEKVNGINAVKFIDDLEDSIADVIISNHCLEHCVSPYSEIKKLLGKLKPGGRIVLYVPHESISNKWVSGGIDQHLYTWNPMTLGNLFESAGYEVETAEPFYHIWPPFYRLVAKFGYVIFNLASYIYGYLIKHNSQVKIVARRPM